jgi:Asp-tRNA(Asn)/Glu-tRNA(Gln) amidotransferase A subunit family amidase
MNTSSTTTRFTSRFSPAYAAAVEMAAAIRQKTISATELLDVTLRRIDRHNPSINAIVWQCREEARARAQQADRALEKGRPVGPLHGVPVTIKEAFAYRGSPSTWGLPPLKSTVSPRTAIAVERLETAGAIVVGKTNVPAMAWQQYFESHDVFLLPGSFTAAFPHDQSEPMGARAIETPEGKRPYVQDVPYWISTATLAGLPATVAPVGATDAGLPVGIQVVAPMWEDSTSIEFAALLSDVIGGFKAPPAFAD